MPTKMINTEEKQAREENNFMQFTSKEQSNFIDPRCLPERNEYEGIKSQREFEKVNNPSHYGGKDNPYEVIKVMEAQLTYEEFVGAMKFNVYKYNARAKNKGKENEDYNKAAFYQNYLCDYIARRSKPA